MLKERWIELLSGRKSLFPRFFLMQISAFGWFQYCRFLQVGQSTASYCNFDVKNNEGREEWKGLHFLWHTPREIPERRRGHWQTSAHTTSRWTSSWRTRDHNVTKSSNGDNQNWHSDSISFLKEQVNWHGYVFVSSLISSYSEMFDMERVYHSTSYGNYGGISL